MPRTGVSYEAVKAVMDKNPTLTLRELREALGTGSMGTLVAHYQKWANEARKAPPTVSEDWSGQVLAILGEVGRIHGLRIDALTAEAEDLKTDLNDLAADNVTLADRLEEAIKETTQVRKELAIAEAKTQLLDNQANAKDKAHGETQAKLREVELELARVQERMKLMEPASASAPEAPKKK